MQNRRAFLRGAFSVIGAAAAAPAIALPTLDEIERLGWRRRFFPGWSTRRRGNSYLAPEFVAREMLQALQDHLVMARRLNREYEALFNPESAPLAQLLRVRVPPPASFAPSSR